MSDLWQQIPDRVLSLDKARQDAEAWAADQPGNVRMSCAAA